jgi:hypothetical protein
VRLRARRIRRLPVSATRWRFALVLDQLGLDGLAGLTRHFHIHVDVQIRSALAVRYFDVRIRRNLDVRIRRDVGDGGRRLVVE